MYEEIPGCQPAAAIDWAAQDSLKSVEPLGVTRNFWSNSLLKLALRLIGIPSFQKNPSAIEALIRSVNIRNNHFAPTMCSTAALSGHPTPIAPLDRAAALVMAARVNNAVRGTKLLLRRMGLAHFGRNDVIISHPRVYDEVRIIGRPGVRLPYVHYFGLHYQILEESIVLTWMPALKWQITNADLTAALVTALHDIGELGTA